MATILIVDDLAANREVLVRLLRYQGHRLVEAADGAEGLAAVRAERPDLVITDVLMPVMDGYELVRKLRLDPVTARIPVLFYTAPGTAYVHPWTNQRLGVTWLSHFRLSPRGANYPVLRVEAMAMARQREDGAWENLHRGYAVNDN